MAHTGRKNADDALALALAAGLAVEEAAQKAGVSPRTAHRRRADPVFVSEVHRRRDAMIDQAAGQLAEALGEATATLRSLLKAESESIRIRAAVAIIDVTLRLREDVELTERLAKLEAALGKQSPLDGSR